jgi:hypothetical protein
MNAASLIGGYNRIDDYATQRHRCRKPMRTIKNETSAFRRRFQQNPLFMVAHLPWLVSSTIRGLRNRVAVKLGGIHRGRKLQPDWFQSTERVFESGHKPVLIPERLPSYTPRWSDSPAGYYEAGDVVKADGDIEDFLADHRWGFLVDAMLHTAPDWHAAAERCTNWIAHHRDKSDRAWEPYSACERLCNLLVFLAVMPVATRERLVDPTLAEFLADSVAWIFRHIEYYGPTETNNHVLNNARALVVGGLATGSDIAFSAGMRTFRRWLPEMVSGSGFLRERSSHYQLVVLNWILDACRFVSTARGEDCDDSRFLAGYAGRMIAAARMLCAQQSSLLAVIGDVSPDADPVQTIRRLRVLYTQLWIDPEEITDRFAMLDDWFRIIAGANIILGNFPQGRLPQKFPTHGHNDVTSFVWLNGTQEILVDPGRYRYTQDPVSLHQLAAHAHNLPTVNGVAPLCEGLRIGGDWKPIPYAYAELACDRTERGLVLSHTGFGRATPVTYHTRTIEVDEDSIAVIDAFTGIGAADVAFHWQFGPGFDSFDVSRSTLCGACVEVRVEVLDADNPGRALPWRSAAAPSWMSRGYGRLLPILSLRLHSEVLLPARILTRFKIQLPR